jgi:CelD/BcsL family acetyltransferase involved in cellulose biosynthesis
VVRSTEAVAQLEADFRHLESVAANTLPFATFEWHLAWCRHFRRHQLGLADEPLFHVLRNAEGTCVGIIPLILTQRRLGTLRYVTLSLLGADPAITEIRTCLVQPGYEERVAAALDTVLASSGKWDWIQWSGADDAFSAALGRRRALDWQPLAPSYVLDLPPTWEAFRSALKRNIRESLRHCYNSLKRDGHAFEFRAAATPDEVQDALDQLFHLHALRAAMTDAAPHPNRFAGSGLRRFMHEVCGSLAARDRVRVFQLTIGGRVVASRIAFLVGDSLYLYYSGFDPEWAKYSVMTTTVAEAIKFAIARGLKTVNLSPGNDVSKTRWGPREVAQQVAHEHCGRLRSRLVRRAYVMARSGDGLLGSLLGRLIPGRRNWS